MEQANNVEEYLKIIKRFDGYPEKYYRGQLEKYKSIPPSLSRNPGYACNEAAIYQETINMSSAEFDGMDTPLERLAKMQHYGIPTRLVDVTVDPLVALYFAVENLQDDSPGVVYVYILDGLMPNSIEAKVLSVLPTIDILSVSNIQETVAELFHEDISAKDILRIVSNPVIIKDSSMLKKSNSRLFQQKGAFLICGNDVIDGAISSSLRSLDTITPCTVIRIPYEYKQKVKDELDLKHDISTPVLFPELPSVASYIKEKYKESVFSPEDKYHVVNVKDNSIGRVKRKSISIVLNQTLKIEEIQQVAIGVMEQFKQKYNVVWAFVAKTGDDYILSNWVLRGQWIDPSLDKRLRPLKLKTEDKGYFWDFEKSFSFMADYNAKYVFEDDKALYMWHHQIWVQFVPVFEKVKSAFQSGDSSPFAEVINAQKKEITRLYMQLQDFGHSRNENFDGFLDLFSQCIGQADDIYLLVENNNNIEPRKMLQIDRLIKKVNDQIDVINEGLIKWHDELCVTEEDDDKYELDKRTKPEFTFTPTLPISKDALKVKFDITPSILPDKTVQIRGKTNLFDGANLLLSLRTNNGIMCSGKGTIVDGSFSFPTCSDHGEGFAPGVIKGTIILSLPNTQPKEFVKLAGIEYEKLSGDFIRRDGVGPSGRFEFSFTVE